MKRDAAEIAELSRLIDAALELPAEERATWIEQLPAANDTFKPALRKLLAIKPADGNSHTLSDVSRQVHMAMQGAVSSTEALEFKDGARVGPYELVRELGRGGMGTVWLARRTEGLTRRTVALKLPHPGMMHAEFAARMERERDILESLAHPNIARLYDAGITPAGQPYLALEYIEGVPIDVYCDAKRLDVRARIQLFVQVLQAIQYAHSHLVIHRDLKPANILVTEAGTAVVLDFGIAKLTVEGTTADTALTQFGGRALTPDFASPEQIAGAPLTTASDVYSLGVILYELLTGERPYRLARGSVGALEEAILAADVRRPSAATADQAKAEMRATTPGKLAHTLRGDLDTIVLKAMRVKLADRYGTADALTLDIQHHLQGRAIDARAESLWEGARRFVVRNKVVVGAACAVVLALAVGLSAALWQARVAREESAKQKASRDFVVGLFESVADNTPEGLAPANATARQMLELGTKRLLDQYKDNSPVRLDLLATLGGLNTSLDLLEAAEKSYDEAIKVARALYGEHDLRYVQVLEEKAEVLVRKGAYDEALKIADEVLAVVGKPTLATSDLYARTHILIGNVRNLSDSPDSPVPRQHLELALAALKGADARTADRSRVSFYLARTFETAGDYAKAEPYYLDGIKAAEANFGPRSYISAFGYENYGDMLRRQRRYAEAEKFMTRGLDIYRTLYGPQHVSVSTTTIDLAQVLLAQGKRQAAYALATEASARIGESRGADSMWMTLPLFNRGRMASAAGDMPLAGRMYESLRAIKALTEQSNRGQLLGAQLEGGRILVMLGDLDGAATLLGKVSDAYTGTPDGVSSRGVRLHLRKGELLIARGQPADAEFKQAFDLLLSLGSNAEEHLPDTLFSMSYVLPEPEVARDALKRVSSLSLIKTLRAGEPLTVDETILLHTGLGRLEMAAGDHDAAGPDLEAALKLRRTFDDASSPWIAVTQAMLAQFYARRGNLNAAKTAADEAQKILDARNLHSPFLEVPLRAARAQIEKL